MQWPKCVVCGKKIQSTRKGVMYCSNRCRNIDWRQSKRDAEAAKKAAMIDTLRGVWPVTAGRLETFAKEHGQDCADAALRLILGAVQEAKLGLVNPEHKAGRKPKRSENVVSLD